MISLQEVQQFIPFIKPLFDGLRPVRDLFKRGASKKSVHSIQIPKQTLILLPGIHPYSLKWGLGKHGATEAMQISGVLRATNTSPYVIHAAGTSFWSREALI